MAGGPFHPLPRSRGFHRRRRCDHPSLSRGFNGSFGTPNRLTCGGAVRKRDPFFSQIGEASMAAEIDVEVFADYFQIYLADPLLKDDWSDAWQTPSALVDRFIVHPRILGFCTGRNATVPLRVSLTKASLNYL